MVDKPYNKPFCYTLKRKINATFTMAMINSFFQNIHNLMLQKGGKYINRILKPSSAAYFKEEIFMIRTCMILHRRTSEIKLTHNR